MLISTEVLDEEVENNGLSAGNAFTQNKLDKFILLLESKYSGSGYYNAEINSSIVVDSQNRARIELNVNQGERVKIDSFSISGGSNISEEKLIEIIQNW